MLHNLRNVIASPYNMRESLCWLAKNITGPSRRNSGIVEPVTSPYILNRIKPQYRLVIVGDILPLGSKHLMIGRRLKDFVSTADYLVGNFEGIITESRRKTYAVAVDQRHAPHIIDALEDFFEPRKTYLCTCNNHAGDFGEEEYFKSLMLLESRGFYVFGWNKRPYCDINGEIRIVSGSAWSNRDCNYLFRLEGAGHHVKPAAFNLLYPHFGFELELYPRPETVDFGKKALSKFDALLGHHPHCPQPVTMESVGGINKLLAYSLGDFCFGLKMKKYQYGITMKIEVGQARDKAWLAGRVEWRLTRCKPSGKNDFIVDLTDDLPF